MIERALQSGLRPRWVLGDEVYGSAGKTRRFIESHDQPYVMAVSSQQRLWIDLKQQRVDKITDTIPKKDWHRISIAQGSKGPRVYDWAAGKLAMLTETGLVRRLLIRRNTDDPSKRAYYFCAAPTQATSEDLAIAAGQRWAIECCFESAKQETGLDEYEVRSWHGGYRHITLSMSALARLSVIRSQASQPKQKKATLTWSH